MTSSADVERAAAARRLAADLREVAAHSRAINQRPLVEARKLDEIAGALEALLAERDALKHEIERLQTENRHLRAEVYE
jgi:hypothetical protein